jgi:SAM-dependent methyltransferase
MMHDARRRQIFADALQILGIDIFDRQTAGLQQFHKMAWNLNISLQNARNEYVKPDMFDLINSRFLTDGINMDRWQSLIRECKRLLKPGCWLQMVEVRWQFDSPGDQALSHLTEWSDAYMDALNGMQKDSKVTESRLEWFVRSAGFERVQKITRRIPVGNWRPGSYLAHIDRARVRAD